MKKGLLSLALAMSIGMMNVSAAEMMGNRLADVTKGAEIRSVSFANSTMEGSAYTNWDAENDQFTLHADFANLPTARGDDFYEGWLVQKSPFKFISTGELILGEDGTMVNKFQSEIDYSTYSFYVLTLEPNDGNPAPADHILEGDVKVGYESAVMMKKEGDHMVESDDTMMMKKEEGGNMMEEDSMMEKDDMMKSESMMEKDDMMKSESMMEDDKTMMMKEELKANKYYLPIKTLLAKYSELELQKIQNSIPKLKEVYENRTDISDAQKAKVLEVINVIALVLEESMEMMMQK